MLDFKFLQKIIPRVYSCIPFYLRPESSFPPFQAFFEVTYRCNLRCDMCHYLGIIEDTETKKKYKDEMSAEDVKQAVASLPKQTLVTFTGGEAFMKTDFMDILRFASSGHKVHAITNGTLLTEQVVEQLMDMRLKSLWGSGFFYLGVSLEGHEALHDRITTVQGSFRKTTEGLERFMKRRTELNSRYPLVHLTCVISRANVMDLVPLYDYANSLGVNVCNFVLDNPATYWHAKDYDQDQHLKVPPKPVDEISPVVLREQLAKLTSRSRSYRTKLRFSPNFITPEEIVRYYSNESSYKDYRCYIPWSKVAVTAYGDVFSCPHVRLGNVSDAEGKIPWHSKKAKDFRNLLKKEKIFPGCLGCCQSEYVGPKGMGPEAIRIKSGGEVFEKVPVKDFVAQPNCNG
jgi:MoaA/NifB/PqqE/SkfB family radical SAM enzyme